MRWTEDERDELRRAILGKRSHLKRVRRDYIHYKALYPTPWIERVLANLKVDFSATWAEYRALKRRWDSHVS